VRGFPTLWRIATEYLFLRKLAPRSRALNAFYAGGFDHDRDCEAEWIMGAVWLVRRAAIDEVGPADDGFFLFSEETDCAWRFRGAGWQIHFVAGAGATHVYGGAHQGRMLAENVKSQLRFLRKHRGDRYAKAAALIIRAGLLLRGRRL
jgi:N-acetylglucosaminyl-diphospho-decaprenol L-rhamnosyltransferase